MNSRSKGKRGELEWAAYCREEFGLTAARRGQQYSGSPDSPDCVTWPGTYAEVKRVEHLPLDATMRKAEQAAGDQIPYIAHRRNRTPWLVTVRACDLIAFCRAVNGGGRDNG